MSDPLEGKPISDADTTSDSDLVKTVTVQAASADGEPTFGLSVDELPVDGTRTITDTTGAWHTETFTVPATTTVNDLKVTFDDSDTAAPSVIEVIAVGRVGGENIELQIDGTVVDAWVLDADTAGFYGSSPAYQTYTYTHPEVITDQDVKIEYTNDASTPDDRDVRVDAIVVDGTRYESEGPGVEATGVFQNGGNCTLGFWESEILNCNGYLDYPVDNPPPGGDGPSALRVGYVEIDGHQYPASDTAVTKKGVSSEGCENEVNTTDDTLDCPGWFDFADVTDLHVPPPPVTGLEPASVTANTVTMTWSPSTDPEVTGYELYQDGAAVESVGTVDSYTFEGLTAGATYELGIRALTEPVTLSDLRKLSVTTTPGVDDLQALVGHVCDAQGFGEVTAELTNGTGSDVTFEISGDGFDARAPLVPGNEALTVALPTLVAGDGSVPVEVVAAGTTVFDGEVAIACDTSVVRPDVTGMDPGGTDQSAPDLFTRPSVELVATADDPLAGGLVFDHQLETLDGQVVDEQQSVGPAWTATMPPGYRDQVLAWTVTVVGGNGAVGTETSYLDAVTEPDLPPCDTPGNEAVTIDSHADGDTVDTGEDGTGTGSFVLAGTVTGADEVVVTVGTETVDAEITATEDPCIRSWSTEVMGAESGAFTFSAAAPGGAAAQVDLDLVAPGADDVLITPAYARTRALDLGALLVSFDPETGALEFSGDLTADLSVGDVIVDDGGTEQAPEGFMRVVDSTSFNGDNTIVGSHQALLTDVFRQVPAQPVPAQGEFAAQGIDYSFSDHVVNASGELDADISGDVDLDGRAELEINWVLDCGLLGCYPRPEVEYFLVEASAQLNASVTLNGTAAAVLDNTLARADVHGPIFVVYGVPITTALEIAPFVRASVEASTTVTVSGSVTAGAGYEYARDGTGRGAYRIRELSGPTLDEAQLLVDSRLDVGTELEIEVFIADAIGPTVSARPALTVQGVLEASPEGTILDWCYGVSLVELALGGEIEIPVIGVELAELDYQFIEPPGKFYEVACGETELFDGPCGQDSSNQAIVLADEDRCDLIDRIVERIKSDDLGPNSRRSGVRNRNALRDVAESCIDTAGTLARAEQFCINGTVFYSGHDNQTEATTHIAAAQAVGHPAELTYENRTISRSDWYYSDESACGRNPQEATTIYKNNGGTRAGPVECDEYPFWATTDGYRPGGPPPPSVRPISANANKSSGGDQGKFANQCPTVKADPPTPYLVVPTPAQPVVVTKSFWTCEPNLPDAPEPDRNDNEFINSSPVITVKPPDGALTPDTRVRVSVTDEGQESSPVTVDWTLRTVPLNGDPTVIDSGTETVQPNSGFILPPVTEDQARNEIELEATATDVSDNSGRGFYHYNTGRDIGAECSAQTDVAEDECLGLAEIYNATNGPNWTNNTNWLDFEAGVCSWHGVICDSSGQVATLRLIGNNLSGHLPPEIEGLTSLTNLDLLSNQITSVPPEIGNLMHLTVLNLNRNELTGLPLEIWGLSSLQALDIAGNQITALPPEIGNLINLIILSIGENQLVSLPPELWELSALESLFLSGNQYTSIPSGLGTLSNLTALDLGDLGLTGLPSEIWNLTNLQRLWVSGNQLTSLPPEIGTLSNLQVLFAYSNQLTSLPANLGDPPNLDTVYLNNNQLTGDVTAPMAGLPDSVTTLNISGNNCLTVSDSTVAAWLDSVDPDWDECGTPP